MDARSDLDIGDVTSTVVITIHTKKKSGVPARFDINTERACSMTSNIIPPAESFSTHLCCVECIFAREGIYSNER